VTGPAVWRLLAPALLFGTGLVAVAGAATADGTDLRTEGQTRLADLVSAQAMRVDALTAQVDALRREVDAAASPRGDPQARATRAGATRLGKAVGLVPVVGPGLSVTLSDAPVPPGGVPEGLAPDDFVVHQQDVQGVVNALWAGGAEALQVMDQRIISTSAVRCVGNTLILQGRVYSPPFTVTAIGPTDRMRRALDVSPAVTRYREWSQAVGLGYDVSADREVTVAGYSGPVDLVHAVPGAAPASSVGQAP